MNESLTSNILMKFFIQNFIKKLMKDSVFRLLHIIKENKQL